MDESTQQRQSSLEALQLDSPENTQQALLDKLKRERVKRYTTQKYKYYIPIGKTEEFLDRVGSGKYFVNAYLAANGVGKTAVIANVLAHLFWPCGNKYFQQPLFTNWPYDLKKARLISDPTTVKTTTIPTLKEWFPQGRYKTEKMGKNYEYLWRTDSDWEFDIMTYDQSLKEFESANLSLAIFDEPPPYDIYIATVSRMRRGGVILVLCTPLNGSAWLYDEIVVNPNREKHQISLTTAEMEDACKVHGVRGFLEHTNIERMITLMDPEERAARAFGKFKHLSGIVFKKFDRDIHVVKPFKIDFYEHMVVEAFDSHPRNPDALMWVAVDRKNNMFIIDEIYRSFDDDGGLAAAINKRRDEYRVALPILEPAAFNVDQHSGYCLAATLQSKYGLYYQPASKRRSDGIRMTRDALNWQKRGDLLIQPPKLYVFETCVRTIFEFTHWKWNEWVSGKEKKSLKESAEDKDDHMMENIGRILLEEPRWVPAPVRGQHSPTMPNPDPYN